MKINIIKETSASMLFELEGEKHTFPALLCWALLKDPKVDFAVYDLDHPLVGTPRIHLRTKKKKPRDAVKDAAKLLKKEFRDLEKEFDKKTKKTPKKSKKK